MAEEQTTSFPVANVEEKQTTPLPETNAELKQDNKRKRKAPKKVPEAAKKKARKNLTLELPKGTVRFDNIVSMKLGKKQKILLLKGYPSDEFRQKRQQQKQAMHQRHLQRNLTPRRLKRQQHVRDTLLKLNSVFVS